MVKVAVIGLAGALLAVLVRNYKSEYGSYVILGIAVLIFGLICTQLKSIISAINTFAEYVNIERKYITILIKMLGIIKDYC